MARADFATKADRWYRRILDAQTPGGRLTEAANAVRALAAGLDDGGAVSEVAELRNEAAALLTGVFVRHLARLGVPVTGEPAPTEEGGSPR